MNIFRNKDDGLLSNSKSDRLRELRLKMKLTQKEFAKLLGIEQSNISKCEFGATPITSNMESRLQLHVPNMSAIWWETGDGEMFVGGVMGSAYLPKEGLGDCEKRVALLEKEIVGLQKMLEIYQQAIKAQEVTIETLKILQGDT